MSTMVLLTGPSRLSVTRKLTEFWPRSPLGCCRPKASALEYVIRFFVFMFVFVGPGPFDRARSCFLLAYADVDFVGAGIAFDADWHGAFPFLLFFIFSLRPVAWRYVHAD